MVRQRQYGGYGNRIYQGYYGLKLEDPYPKAMEELNAKLRLRSQVANFTDNYNRDYLQASKDKFYIEREQAQEQERLTQDWADATKEALIKEREVKLKDIDVRKAEWERDDAKRKWVLEMVPKLATTYIQATAKSRREKYEAWEKETKGLLAGLPLTKDQERVWLFGLTNIKDTHGKVIENIDKLRAQGILSPDQYEEMRSISGRTRLALQQHHLHTHGSTDILGMLQERADEIFPDIGGGTTLNNAIKAGDISSFNEIYQRLQVDFFKQPQYLSESESIIRKTLTPYWDKNKETLFKNTLSNNRFQQSKRIAVNKSKELLSSLSQGADVSKFDATQLLQHIQENSSKHGLSKGTVRRQTFSVLTEALKYDTLQNMAGKVADMGEQKVTIKLSEGHQVTKALKDLWPSDWAPVQLEINKAAKRWEINQQNKDDAYNILNFRTLVDLGERLTEQKYDQFIREHYLSKGISVPAQIKDLGSREARDFDTSIILLENRYKVDGGIPFIDLKAGRYNDAVIAHARSKKWIIGDPGAIPKDIYTGQFQVIESTLVHKHKEQNVAIHSRSPELKARIERYRSIFYEAWQAAQNYPTNKGPIQDLQAVQRDISKGIENDTDERALLEGIGEGFKKLALEKDPVGNALIQRIGVEGVDYMFSTSFPIELVEEMAEVNDLSHAPEWFIKAKSRTDPRSSFKSFIEKFHNSHSIPSKGGAALIYTPDQEFFNLLPKGYWHDTRNGIGSQLRFSKNLENGPGGWFDFLSTPKTAYNQTEGNPNAYVSTTNGPIDPRFDTASPASLFVKAGREGIPFLFNYGLQISDVAKYANHELPLNEQLSGILYNKTCDEACTFSWNGVTIPGIGHSPMPLLEFKDPDRVIDPNRLNIIRGTL